MLKFEFRKLAMVIIALAAVGMMAACSGSSSTDDPLTPPGDNYLGTVRFDVDPVAGTVDVTPVASAWSTTPILGDGSGNIAGIAISTANVSADGRVFDVSVKVTDTTKDVGNLRLGVNASTNMGVTLPNSDNCTGAWSTCLPGINPSIVYVGEAEGDGQPALYTACDPFFSTPTDCRPIYRSDTPNVGAGCASNGLTENWQLGGAITGGFTFWATLFGDMNSTDPVLDSRYDPSVANFYLTIHSQTATANALGGQITSAKPSQWFYVQTYVDYPGNNRPGIGVNGGGIEDQDNIAAWNYGASSTANYYYVSQVYFGIRFDPAIIRVNSYPATISSNDPPGNGAFTFTAGATKIKMVMDPNLTLDGIDFTDANNNAGMLVSNMMGIYRHHNTTKIQTASYFYANPCGRRDISKVACNPGHGTDGFATLDLLMWYAPLGVEPTATAGKVTHLRATYDSNSYIQVARTDNQPGGSSHTLADGLTNANYGTVCTVDDLPRASCSAPPYNVERKYLCIVP